MKILWACLTLLMIVYESKNQMTRQMTFSNSGNILPYINYFDVYQSQTVTVKFSTRCPNLRYNFVDSGGNLVHSKSTYYYNNGYTYSYSFTIGAGFSQSISLIDWNNAKLCNWSYSFSLSFKCDVVTTNCNDCSSYTTCISCVYGYFLYMNKCYTNIANCLTRSGLSCTQCAPEYVLVNGACRLCSYFMPDCKTCSSTSICSTCKNGFALKAGNIGCQICSTPLPHCVLCSSSTVCTSCQSKYTWASTTCQLCTATLPNCITCNSISQCTKCDPGYAIAADGSCQTCSSFIADCVLCSSRTTCTKCPSGYSLSATACTICNVTIAGCRQCLGNDCLSCQDGYWFNNGLCDLCNTTLSKCLTCMNSTWCNSCETNYGTRSWTNSISNVTVFNRNCYLCSSYLSQCQTCSTTDYCNSCKPFYAIQWNRCQSCSSLLNACSDCYNQYNCKTCVNNQFAISSSNRCQACSSYMDDCITCSDRSTCNSCKTGTVLKDSRCKPCYIAIPFCKTCSTQNTCVTCQLTYMLDVTTGTCKPCQFFLANCSVCSSTTYCTKCIPGTILNSGQCKTCDQVFPNCIACVSNISCALCGQGSVVFNNYCSPCSNFINHCANCLQIHYCEECFDPYITDANKKCKCKPPLYNVSDFCVPDPNCVNAIKKDGQVICTFCNIKNLFYLNESNWCVCKKGYKQINEQCVQYCGDGMKVNQQCDDNNTISGDGCSSQCKIQQDFTCQQLLSGVSFCRFVKNIQLRFLYTFKKLHENKGQITVILLSNHPSIIKFYESSLFKFDILHNRSNSLNISSFYKNEKGQILINIDYNETIQNTSIELQFMFDATYVLSEDNYLRFQLKGSNYPLVISTMTQNYKFNSDVMRYMALIGYGIVLLSLFSDKFIAVQGINTIQLTFFSLLLIYQNTDWPQAMVALMPLKFSTGFNQLIFQPNSFDNINSNAYRKYQYIGICNYFLPNNLINSIMLFVAFSVFLIVFYIKLKPQNEISQLNDGPEKKKLSRQLNKIRRIFKRVYNFTFHYSYIMILQVIVSIYVQFSFVKSISKEIKIINKFITMITLSIILITILQNYNHFFLSVKDTFVQNFKVGSRQMYYKRIYFIYIILNAVGIFLLNDKKFFNLTMSFYLLITAVIYLLFLVIYRPYKHSFLIHGFTVILNQVMYILTLLIINAINFQLKLPQIYFLTYSYLMLSLTFVVLVFVVIRVFYDYKYGQEKTQRQIQFQIEGNKQQQKQLLLNKTAKMGDKKKENKKNHQNSYLYQNRKLQAEQIDFLNQLKKKSFLSEWEKDQAYFRVYDRKPIGWVQKNQTQEKYKILLQKQKQRFQRDIEKQQMIKIKNQKLLSKNYIEEMQKIKEKLRNQHAIKQQKKTKKKSQKNSKINTDKMQKK